MYYMCQNICQQQHTFFVDVSFVVLEIWFVTPAKFLPSPVDGADKKSQLDTLETRSPTHFSQNTKWNTLRQVLIWIQPNIFISFALQMSIVSSLALISFPSWHPHPAMHRSKGGQKWGLLWFLALRLFWEEVKHLWDPPPGSQARRWLHTVSLIFVEAPNFWATLLDRTPKEK